MMKKASHYELDDQGRVKCHLCPHHCRINNGQAGRCKVRVNLSGTLIAKSFGLVSALHFDPVEKKPLYHFFPGKSILSVGSFGCNMQCNFCQNWEISQCFPEYPDAFRLMSPKQIVQKASENKTNIGIAFTYNEPVISYEFVYELSVGAKEAGLQTAMITNGYISEKPMQQLLPFIDAFNVDLKVFSNTKYKSYTGCRLDPVLKTLKDISQSGKHLEVTHLVVSGMNDKTEIFTPMINWISKELGELTILHLSRYFPNYKATQAPTSPSVLNYFYDTAREKLPYTYLGNIILSGTCDTMCHNCQTTVIRRQAYKTSIIGLNTKGECTNCGQHIIRHLH